MLEEEGKVDPSAAVVVAYLHRTNLTSGVRYIEVKKFLRRSTAGDLETVVQSMSVWEPFLQNSPPRAPSTEMVS